MNYAGWLMLAAVALVLHFLMPPLTGLEQLWLFLGGMAVGLIYLISLNVEKILNELRKRPLKD